MDGLVSEQAIQTFLAHVEHLRQVTCAEIRLQMWSVGLNFHLNDCHELTVVFQVSIALPFYVSLEQFFGHRHTPAHLIVFFEPFGEVEVTAHEPYQFIPESIYFLFERSVLVLQFLYLFL